MTIRTVEALIMKLKAWVFWIYTVMQKQQSLEKIQEKTRWLRSMTHASAYMNSNKLLLIDNYGEMMCIGCTVRSDWIEQHCMNINFTRQLTFSKLWHIHIPTTSYYLKQNKTSTHPFPKDSIMHKIWRSRLLFLEVEIKLNQISKQTKPKP